MVAADIQMAIPSVSVLIRQFSVQQMFEQVFFKKRMYVFRDFRDMGFFVEWDF